ncbi:MAG: hypothetical protein AABX04_01435 [Nanoarchaeota archaeon]
MKFVLKKARKFELNSLKGWAYNSKEDFAKVSAAYLEVKGRHGKIKNIKSDRTYFVLGGKGEFIINNKVSTVEKNEVIIVPRNTPYDYKATKGILKLFLVDSPAFDPKTDVKLE